MSLKKHPRNLLHCMIETLWFTPWHLLCLWKTKCIILETIFSIQIFFPLWQRVVDHFVVSSDWKIWFLCFPRKYIHDIKHYCFLGYVRFFWKFRTVWPCCLVFLNYVIVTNSPLSSLCYICLLFNQYLIKHFSSIRIWHILYVLFIAQNQPNQSQSKGIRKTSHLYT